MYIQEVTQTIPPHIQNTISVCKQITLLILYYILSRLVTFLNLTDATTQISDILVPTLRFKFIAFIFQIFRPYLQKCLNVERITLLRLSTLLWFESYKHCI